MSVWSNRVATLAAKIEADQNFGSSVSALLRTIAALDVSGEEPAPAPDPEPVYAPANYVFDGTNHLNRGAGLTGAVDGKVGTIAGLIDPDAWASASGQHIIRQSGAFVSPLSINAAGDLQVWLKNAAGAEIVKLRLPNSAFVAGQLNHFAFSWDLADVAKRHGYANDVEALIVDLWTDDTIDWTVTDWRLGDGPGGIRYLGQTADLGLWLEYAALSTLAVRRKFVGASGAAVDIGSDGSLATGTAPILLLGSTKTNLGTGGGFLLPVVAEPAPPPVETGTTITATAGTFSAIQAAVDAASDGDTVLVPNGDWLFGNGQLATAKGIHIKGNGRDVCKIRRSAASPDDMFVIDPSPNGPFRFSGITLEGRAPNEDKDRGIRLRGGMQDFEIFGCRFAFFGWAGVQCHSSQGPSPGNAQGVIYDNQFTDCWSFNPTSGKTQHYAIAINGDPASVSVPVALGTDAAVYIEDNRFTRCRAGVASNNASRYVFRHNVVEAVPQGTNHLVDAHGEGSWPEGSTSLEVYENELNCGSEHTAWRAIGIRGGQGVVFNNAITGARNGITMYLDDFNAKLAAGQQNDIHDVYVWGNTDDDGPIASISFPAGFQEEAPTLIVEDEHYFFAEKPGYTPFTYPHPLRGA